MVVVEVKRGRRARGKRTKILGLARSGLAASLVGLNSCSMNVEPQQDPAANAPRQAMGGSQPQTSTAAETTLVWPPTIQERQISEDSIFAGQLRENDLVHDANIARRFFYSWTTEEQYRELRAGADLLSRSERPGEGVGALQQVLRNLAKEGDALSAALAQPQFEKVRYGWSNPWGAILGTPEESYGNRLIGIEIKREAYVVMVMPNRQETFATDRNQQLVPTAEVLANPERIGAVFYLSEGQVDASSYPLTCSRTFWEGASGLYREYMLPNEAMISRWMLDTDGLLADLDRGIEVAQSYRKALLAQPLELDRNYDDFPDPLTAFNVLCLCLWQGHGTVWFRASRDDRLFLSTLALASEPYIPSVENMDALIEALEGARFEPDPYVRVLE